ncbi:MAG: T9SS type A sorting domain-containing protein [Candidatus Latescibacterota bacterium]|nr:MAG: T9SS type A sorting domain-containing protein [Candidatus Latescibacterota bacterium]
MVFRHSSPWVTILPTFAILCFSVAGSVKSQTLGSEFAVQGTSAGGEQYVGDVDMDPNGAFVVVWDRNDDDLRGVFGRLFTSPGWPVGDHFQINTTSDGYQTSPDVAMDAAGRFMTVWYSNQPAGGPGFWIYNIFGRCYDNSGNPLGDEFLISVPDSASQAVPSVTLARWEYLALWMYTRTLSKEVRGFRFDMGGSPIGSEFTLLQKEIGYPFYEPTVSGNPLGQYVLAFVDDDDNDPDDMHEIIRAKTGTLDGGPGPLIDVSLYSGVSQWLGSVDMNGLGEFIVVWYMWDPDGLTDTDVYAQRFDPEGNPVGPRMLVNETTEDRQDNPDVVLNDNGDFVVVYESSGAGREDIYARIYDAAAGDFLPELQISHPSWDLHRRPMIATDGHGHYIIVYDRRVYDGMFWRRIVISRPMEWRLTDPSAVGDDRPPSLTVELTQNYPNPFKPPTTIEYTLPQAMTVRIDVFDARGSLVKTIEQGHRSAGSHVVTWGGRDNNGTPVGSGTYFCRLVSDDQMLARKMILIR